MQKIQKVVRTTTPDVGYWSEPSSTVELEKLLADGYEVVMCNTIKRKDGQEWLEYIVEREWFE